jgi:hypothetical protein
VILTVPGYIYYECLDPHCTEFPREHPDIAKPTWRKMGFGGQFTYDVTEEQYADILSHVLVFGQSQSSGVDDPSVGRRIVKWVEKKTGKDAWQLEREWNV